MSAVHYFNQYACLSVLSLPFYLSCKEFKIKIKW